MNKHKTFDIWRNHIIQTKDISPLQFGMSQEKVIEILGQPDVVSTMKIDGKPLILKYRDVEFHFDKRYGGGLFLVYSDYEIELSIMQNESS